MDRFKLKGPKSDIFEELNAVHILRVKIILTYDDKTGMYGAKTDGVKNSESSIS